MIIKPLSVQFEITEACTHRCRHCYNYFNHNSRTEKTKKDIIDIISEQEFFDVTLTGGEPLVCKDLLNYSLLKFKEKNMDVKLNSNLYLLNNEDARRFKENGLDSVLGSILGSDSKKHDSLTGVNGSFRKLLDSTKYLLGQEIPFALNMVVNKNNLSDVYNTGKLTKNLGANAFCATPMVISPNKDLKDLELSDKEYIQTLDTLLELNLDFGLKIDSLHPPLPCMFDESEREKYRMFFDKRSCVAGTGTLTFSPSGDVRPCSHSSLTYGNIVENSLDEILEGMQIWRDDTLVPEECNPCAYLEKCRGGCRVSAEAFTGKLNGLEPYFKHPLKNKIPELPKRKIKLENLKPVKGNIRYRDEPNSYKTIYVSSRINSRVTEDEFNVLRRFMAGKTYNEIISEVENPEIIEKISKSLASKHLLI